jgi:four helix bundle protein
MNKDKRDKINIYKEISQLQTCNLEIYMRMFFIFIKRIYPILRNFPTHERYALTQDIKKYFLAYLDNVNKASNVKSKRLYYAEKAESELHNIKIALTVACHEKYISIGFYKDISAKLTEVDKMLTGYIRNSHKK